MKLATAVAIAGLIIAAPVALAGPGNSGRRPVT